MLIFKDTWVTKKLCWWLKTQFGEEWEDKGYQMCHGQQEDWILCVICTGNTELVSILCGVW